MGEITNVLTLIIIAILIAGLVSNSKGTARVINSASGFFARAFNAELGHTTAPPKGN